MNKKLVLFLSLVLIIGFWVSKYKRKVASSNPVVLNLSSKGVTPISTPTANQAIPADRIEVVHFHGTHQCWSCIAVGEYALKTIKEKFPEEFSSGKIVYKDINGELRENRDIVIKYQAKGSSLFINTIRDGKEHISEDVAVWRLVNNETQFANYFEGKLKTLLGK